MTLAAGAAAAGFLSFTPTAYSGLAQLGIIAGFGMVVAYVSSLTLLPALIRAVNPPPEPKPLTFAALAPADAFLKRHRVAVIAVTALIVLAGLPAFPGCNSISIHSPWRIGLSEPWRRCSGWARKYR